jgi:hypothetical protein
MDFFKQMLGEGNGDNSDEGMAQITSETLSAALIVGHNASLEALKLVMRRASGLSGKGGGYLEATMAMFMALNKAFYFLKNRIAEYPERTGNPGADDVIAMWAMFEKLYSQPEEPTNKQVVKAVEDFLDTIANRENPE